MRHPRLLGANHPSKQHGVKAHRFCFSVVSIVAANPVISRRQAEDGHGLRIDFASKVVNMNDLPPSTRSSCRGREAAEPGAGANGGWPWMAMLKGLLTDYKHAFEVLQNPRKLYSCGPLLFDSLMIAVLAVTCGADDWCSMAAIL
ncbi:MAG: hypothetical protein IT427_14170 [Pirellulales bacterium]|nr:hypothetical protein [Pirellulales bacterium]